MFVLIINASMIGAMMDSRSSDSTEFLGSGLGIRSSERTDFWILTSKLLPMALYWSENSLLSLGPEAFAVTLAPVAVP